MDRPRKLWKVLDESGTEIGMIEKVHNRYYLGLSLSQRMTSTGLTKEETVERLIRNLAKEAKSRKPL